MSEPGVSIGMALSAPNTVVCVVRRRKILVTYLSLNTIGKKKPLESGINPPVIVSDELISLITKQQATMS